MKMGPRGRERKNPFQLVGTYDPRTSYTRSYSPTYLRETDTKNELFISVSQSSVSQSVSQSGLKQTHVPPWNDSDPIEICSHIEYIFPPYVPLRSCAQALLVDTRLADEISSAAARVSHSSGSAQGSQRKVQM